MLWIGSESWDCGGNMTPEYYLRQLTIYSRFVRNFNPSQQSKDEMQKIAVDPGGGEARSTESTDTIMKAGRNDSGVGTCKALRCTTTQ